VYRNVVRGGAAWAQGRHGLACRQGRDAPAWLVGARRDGRTERWRVGLSGRRGKARQGPPRGRVGLSSGSGSLVQGCSALGRSVGRVRDANETGSRARAAGWSETGSRTGRAGLRGLVAAGWAWRVGGIGAVSRGVAGRWNRHGLASRRKWGAWNVSVMAGAVGHGRGAVRRGGKASRPGCGLSSRKGRSAAFGPVVRAESQWMDMSG
jgi:hypothetical protein